MNKQQTGRKPTSAERLAESTARRAEARRTAARDALIEAKRTLARLELQRGMADLVRATREHLEWLIREDEAYAAAAAELWLAGLGASAGDEANQGEWVKA